MTGHLNGEDFICEHCGVEKDTLVRIFTDDDIGLCDLCFYELKKDDPDFTREVTEE